MDYEKIGLKVGLEIHQQLATGKLFSRTPSLIRDDEPHYTIKRRLRAVFGESGQVDKAAKAEHSKEKYFLYQGYDDTISLVELDEEPPQPMDEDALYTALQVCKLLGANIFENIRVMRKTVIDGSNTSGFQRTSLIASGGQINSVPIESICLEEDSAKITKRTHEFDTYNLSRLGIPLIEIATAPTIKTPEQAKEIALALGMLLRSTGKAKRGIGTIRQDLNISIKGGERIEMKGVQELKLIPSYVENEIMRQQILLKIFSELNKVKASVDNTIYNLTELLHKSQAKVIQSALKQGGAVLAIKLEKFKGFLGKEIQPGRRFGSELSDYAKTQGVKGLFHSDELPKYGITDQEVKAISAHLKCKKDDAFILIADKENIAKRSIQAVILRASNLKIIKEVRQAKPDGTSSYIRPMPGADRMYPETDVPSVTPNTKNITLPELIDDKEIRLAKQYSISKDLASQLAKQGYDFDSYTKKYVHVDKTLLAEVFVSFPKELKKRYDLVLDQEAYEKSTTLVLEKLNAKEITAQAFLEILSLLGKNKKVDWEKFKPIDEKQIDILIKNAVKKDPDAPIGALMGIVMGKLQGRANGKIVMKRLKELRK